MKKLSAIWMAMVLLVTCLAGCGAAEDSDKAYVEKNQKLVVGITEYAPMDFKDPDTLEWTGFDAEFARLFAKELGVECEFFVLPQWDTKFMELETKQIDAIWNGMTITEEARLNSSVSDPYVVNAQVVVMKKDILSQYPSGESLSGLSIAVESGSAGESCAKEIPDAKLVPLKDQAAALMEVAAGTSEACVVDITMANAMTGDGSSYSDLGYTLKLSEELYGVSFRNNSDLTEVFNSFLAKVKADGSLQKLADKYGLTLAEN